MRATSSHFIAAQKTESAILNSNLILNLFLVPFHIFSVISITKLEKNNSYTFKPFKKERIEILPIKAHHYPLILKGL